MAGSQVFVNLTNGNGIAGATAARLSVMSLTKAMMGDQFRVLVTGATGTATGEAIVLTVDKTVATVTLSGLVQVFTGGSRSATV